MKKQLNRIKMYMKDHPRLKWIIIIGLILGFLIQISIPIIAAISLIK